MSRFTAEFIINVTLPSQLTLTNKEEDITFNKVWIQAIIPSNNKLVTPENKINIAMRNLMEDKTCFVIAHRLSTVRNADLILVVNDGEIVEQGTHQELLALNGFYSKIYNAQFI